MDFLLNFVKEIRTIIIDIHMHATKRFENEKDKMFSVWE